MFQAPANRQRRSLISRLPLDNRPSFRYIRHRISLTEGRQPVTPVAGASAVPAGGGSSPPLPGGSGDIRPAGTMTGLRGNPLGWDSKRRGGTPTGAIQPFTVVLDCSVADAPRNDELARGCEQDPGADRVAGMLSRVVIAGLDPAIHAAYPLTFLPHVFSRRISAWTTGSNPVVTKNRAVHRG
jgi:hypothetical protein